MTSAARPDEAGPAAVPPSALDSHLGFWLRMVSNEVSAGFGSAVEALGVTVSEWVALRLLFDGEGATQGYLVAALGMTKGAVSKIAGGLEAKGLIARSARPDDGRSEGLLLTAAGRALVPRLAAAADRNEERFFGHLSPAQRAALRDALESVATRHGIDEVPVR